MKLTVARNILLLTLLMDGYDDESFEDIWSLFFDLYISSSALQLIRKQSKKLAQFSTNMDAWNSSPYAQHLHIANLDTLNLLFHFWIQYSSHVAPYEKSYRSSINEIYKTEYEGKESSALHRAAGPFSLTLGLFHRGDTFKAYEYYWKMGTYSNGPDLLGCTNCNPLFAYSRAGGLSFPFGRIPCH